MRVRRVLLADVLGEIDLRLALERAREIHRDRLPEAKRRLARQRASRLRHRPGEEHRLDDEHRREKRDDAEGDAPVQTPVPVHRHVIKKS